MAEDSKLYYLLIPYESTSGKFLGYDHVILTKTEATLLVQNYEMLAGICKMSKELGNFTTLSF